MSAINAPAIPIITGPTGVGKTALSVEVAESLGAEIISADSRQIYRQLDIGTAKPSRGELARVPHHFINELDLDVSYSAGRFQEDANRRINEIRSQGNRVLIAGGSTLYIHALKNGLADIPDVPPSVRAEIQERLDELGAEALYAELQDVDPVAARSMDPSKTQRLVRALEVFAATGRPLSAFHSAQTPPPLRFRTIVLHRDRRLLYERINRRVDDMLEAGLLEEVRSLLASGFDPTLNPLQTIGYQEPISYLRGQIPYEEMVRLIKRNTRRYAKRQLTWFRRDSENNAWVDAELPVEDVIKRIRSDT